MYIWTCACSSGPPGSGNMPPDTLVCTSAQEMAGPSSHKHMFEACILEPLLSHHFIDHHLRMPDANVLIQDAGEERGKHATQGGDRRRARKRERERES